MSRIPICAVLLVTLGIGLSAHPSRAQDPPLLLQWGGPGNTPGLFVTASDVAVSASDRVYVSDYGDGWIQVFDVNGAFITRWNATCTCGAAPHAYQPVHIAVDTNEMVYVSNRLDHGIDRYAWDGTQRTSWSAFPAWALAIGPNGHVYATDNTLGQVAEIDTSGIVVRQWGSFGAGPSQFEYPDGIAVASDGSVYVSDLLTSRIQHFAPDGSLLVAWGSPGLGDGQFSNVSGLGSDVSGNLYAADNANGRIQVFSASGTYLTQWSIGVAIQDVALDLIGNVYVISDINVRKYGRPSTPVRRTTWGSLKSAYR